jgi:hypothetical protein
MAIIDGQAGSSGARDRHVLEIQGDDKLCPTVRDLERLLEYA